MTLPRMLATITFLALCNSTTAAAQTAAAQTAVAQTAVAQVPAARVVATQAMAAQTTAAQVAATQAGAARTVATQTAAAQSAAAQAGAAQAATAQAAAADAGNDAGRKVLYLANPYGFSAQQAEGPLAELVAALEALGAEVWEPFARTSVIDPGSPGWAYRIGQTNLQDVRDADGVFAVVNGCPPDEGVMVELGLAFAWQKTVFLFRDDFRRCTDSEAYPLNLMAFIGLPETGWEAYWYAAVEELADPGKALVPWLRPDGTAAGE